MTTDRGGHMKATSSLECGDPKAAWAWEVHAPAELAERARAGERFIAPDIVLTEQLAESLLEGQELNDRLNMTIVRQIERDIRAGRWEQTPETMKIVDGRMTDGQKRCHGRLRAGKDVPVSIAFNWPRAEEGRRQGTATAAQILQRRGVGSAHLVAAVCRMVWLNDLGLPVIGRNEEGAYPDAVEIADVLEVHPRIKSSVSLLTGNRWPRGMSRRDLAYLHYRIAMHDREEAARFLGAFRDPVSAGGIAMDNVGALLTAVERETVAARPPRGWDRHRYSWLMRTWTATVAGRAVGRFAMETGDLPLFTPPRNE